MVRSTVIKDTMTARGNKDKVLASTYVLPTVLKKFKAKCALYGDGIAMTRLIEGFMEKFVVSEGKETDKLVNEFYKKED